HNQLARTKLRELLAHGRGFDLELGLQVRHGTLAVAQQLENPDPHRMPQRLEQLRLEPLQHGYPPIRRAGRRFYLQTSEYNNILLLCLAQPRASVAAQSSGTGLPRAREKACAGDGYPQGNSENMIAILEASRVGLLQRDQWARNIVAGAIVGVVSLPLAMAFAIASGVKPEQGLYTAIIAGLLVTLFGGSRVQIAGPTGAFIVILSGIVANHGYAGLQLATIMAGFLLILMGFLRMGAVLRFIPAPVIVGFTAGIGVIIWIGQWPSFFGIADPEGEHFHQKLPNLIASLPDLDPAATLLATLGLLILIFAPRLPLLQRIPAPLIAMVVVTVLYRVLGLDGVETVGSRYGGIHQGLPGLAPPQVSLDRIVDLIGPASTIAMLCAIESLLSAVVAD